MRRHIYRALLLGAAASVLAALYVGFRRDGPPVDGVAGGMPHATHAPRHGGMFFMAADGFHHLEGTRRGNEFRLYIYDNFTQPVDARRFLARVGEHSLVPDASGEYLELTLTRELASAPTITAMVRFRPDGPEQLFDFTF